MMALAVTDEHYRMTTVSSPAVEVAGPHLTGNAFLAEDDLSDALSAAIDGDPRGFAVLWRSLQPAVLRYLTVVCADAAEDVASETWLQVSRDLSGFRGDAVSFRVWVFRIARHRGIDENRRAWRRREEANDGLDALRESQVVRDISLDVIEMSETERALALIRSLPPDQSEAVMLRVVAGLDVAGTASVLGKRPGAVRIAAMRGLRRLAADPQVQQFGRPSADRPDTSTPSAKDGLR
jgi:RNA polymerase sigma-70 factor (ECF subfamily)